MASDDVVVGLLHRADWTRLSLAAQASDGSTVLLAPGRRYRHESEDGLAGCDGNRAWELPRDDEDGTYGAVQWPSRPEPPLPELLCPGWLLAGSRLEVRGRTRVCDRDGWEVVLTRRAGSGRRVTGMLGRRTEAVVDAELGIVLRLVRQAGGPQQEVTELVSLDVDPVTDPQLFAPPAGSRDGEPSGEGPGGGPGRAAATIAGLAAGGLGAWIRHSAAHGGGAPGAKGAEGDVEMPPCDPAPQLLADGAPAGAEVSDEVLARLHQGGAGHYTATVHQWSDLATMASQVPAGARGAGFGGVGRLADAISERATVAHVTSALRVGAPGQYQIDREYPSGPAPAMEACDGQRRWRVRDGKATVGPAKPPPRDIEDLTDPSWLLSCRLSGGEPVTAGGRPAYRLEVLRGDGWRLSMMFPAAVAVVDAELGIVLGLTSYIGTQPVQLFELRDLTADPARFQVDLPPGTPVTEETSPFSLLEDGTSPAQLPLAIATVLGRQAAKEAGKVTRHLLDRLQPRRPTDGE
jgi:hypothetical protein